MAFCLADATSRSPNTAADHRPQVFVRALRVQRLNVFRRFRQSTHLDVLMMDSTIDSP
jgi:hypothetical protein